MATYFHGNPDAAADGLQTLVLMNPSYVQYSDTPPPPQPPPQFVGIPLDHHPHHQNHHELSSPPAMQHRLHHYNLYSSTIDPEAAARDTPRAHQQGLSLTLSNREQQAAAAAAVGGYGSGTMSEDHCIRVSAGSGSSSVTVANNGGGGTHNGMQLGVLVSSKYLKAAQELLDEVVNVNGNGNNGGVSNNKKKGVNNSSAVGGDKAVVGGESSGAGDGKVDQGGAQPAADLSTAERQEIQMKKAKLISMLDEVEQRYRQYHHQMQAVIAAFEQAAGIGTAKTYTALALKTISKQFRCLRDAITGQIKAANKSLGEEESPGGGKIEGSRLKFVDHHLRQQRALQQLGMIQHNAWRPQRGLPERSVSILRAWLFEHFLHPYPKDSDKHMLAKQTGLTRSQVSNWFINARVRLWKPMVEEMYTEEMKDQEHTGDKITSNKSDQNEDSSSQSVPFHHDHKNLGSSSFRSSMENNNNNNSPNQNVPSGISISTFPPNLRNHSAFSITASSELEGITQASPKKPRHNNNNHIDMLQLPSPTSVDHQSNNNNDHHDLIKFVDERQGRDAGYSFMGVHTNFMQGAFGQYPIAEIGRFDPDQFTQRFSSGNGVNLSLGLPEHHSFLPNQSMQLGIRRPDQIGEANEFGAIASSDAPHSSTTYESINIQNRKGFAAPLLPDFVT
ncbi:BEL1-like homeodomain protein 1 [Linum grandiflorum]